VRIEGSAYRRPGAKLLIEEGGASLGGISGGCLEEDVREVGREVLRSGKPRLRHYDTGTEDTRVWGLGLGCNGRVDVFVQPVATEWDREVWRRIRDRLREDTPFAVATVVAGPGAGAVLAVGEPAGMAGTLGDRALDEETGRLAGRALAAGESRVVELDGRRLFVEVLLPPPCLLVCGAGDDAIPLVASAVTVGFRVAVADHRSAFVSPERFPGARGLFVRRPEEDLRNLPLGPRTYAVVMTHSLKHDREWLRRLLETDVPYIGVLGPRARAEKMLDDVGVASGERVYGPVGLDLGAEGAEQVAVSIVAEVLAVASRREPRHLRGKQVAVHA
jgi:xanthine/CO dehydrogenase XdhC/CoxF family maturation factor